MSVAANVAFGPHSRRGSSVPPAPTRRRRPCAGCARSTPSASPTGNHDSCPGTGPAGGDRARTGRRARCVAAGRAADRARRRRGRRHPRGAAQRGHPDRLRGHPDHPRPAGRVHTGRSSAGARIGEDRRDRPSRRGAQRATQPFRGPHRRHQPGQRSHRHRRLAVRPLRRSLACEPGPGIGRPARPGHRAVAVFPPTAVAVYRGRPRGSHATRSR